jgi:hypothetical protein
MYTLIGGCEYLNAEGSLLKTQAIFELACSIRNPGAVLFLDLVGLQIYVLIAPRSNSLHLAKIFQTHIFIVRSRDVCIIEAGKITVVALVCYSAFIHHFWQFYSCSVSKNYRY